MWMRQIELNQAKMPLPTLIFKRIAKGTLSPKPVDMEPVLIGRTLAMRLKILEGPKSRPTWLKQHPAPSAAPPVHFFGKTGK